MGVRMAADVILTKGRDKRIKSRHPWVYRSEIQAVDGDFAPGDIVDVKDCYGKFLGRGYINPQSEIVVRVLTYEKEEVDRSFFRNRIEKAKAYRAWRMPDEHSYRAVFSEGDLMPGLIVDKYGDYLVVQFLTLGMDVRRDMLLDILEEVYQPVGIYERSDVGSRRLEGLPEQKGLLRGQVPSVIRARENGLKFIVDVQGGQKTGFFLDQKENRRLLQPISRGARVLDAFCHSGTFALTAAASGAKDVIGLDISADALGLAGENAELNGLADVCRFITVNAFDYLRQAEQDKEHYDVIILDPPAFTKTRGAVGGALRGYKEINLRAFKLLRPGGFLLTCSCSHHVNAEMFRNIVENAGADAKRVIRLIARGTQAPDHPILGNVPETEYLKALLYQAL
jgi:23S rRNA (cytosine1962-C5)-methyltransferase